MKQQKLSNWVWLSFAVSVFVAFPAKADTKRESAVQPDTSNPQSPITEIPRLNEIARPVTTVEEWLSQFPTPDTQSQVQITGVRLNPTANGIDVILETAGGEALQSSTSTEGNSLIVNIPNAQLQLPEGKEFRARNPVADITSIDVTNATSNSVRVTVTGSTGVPAGQVVSSARGLILSLTQAPQAEETQTPQAEEEIEIVVTAEKQPEDVQDVPISITAITEEEIEDADITSLSDIAANTPNFSTFTSSRSSVQYSIRGLSNFNFLSRDPVAFFIDDVPYDYTAFLNVDLPDVERVEVLRGPQGTLYGRFAEAGAVNIITRKPTNNFEFNSSTSYGNYDNLDLRAGASGPVVEDKVFYRLSGSYASRDGYIENAFLDSDVDEQSGGTGRAQLLWTPSEDWEIAVNTSFDDYRDGVPLNLLGADRFEVEQDFDGFNDLNSNTQSLRVAYNHSDFRLTAITARRFSDQDFESEADVTTADFLRQIIAIDSTVFSQEIRLQSPEEANEFEWLLGGYFESRDFNVGADSFSYGPDAVARGFVPVSGEDRNSAEVNETTLAFFGQASYQPIAPLTLTAGLRYESFDSTLENKERTFIPDDGSAASPSVVFNDIEQDGDIVLPRFVVEYRFNPNIMAYGTIARGYRPQGVNFRADTEELLTFEAEKAWNYEVGLKSNWFNDRLAVNLAVFHSPVDDFQVAVPDASGFFRDVANGEVSITGFEVEVRATPLEGLDAIAGFGFVDSEFTDYTNPFSGQSFNGNKLPYVPDFTYNLALQYRARNGIFARVELQGLGTTFFEDANRFKQGPFALLNARLGYEFDNYGIYLFANNITDVEYLTSAAAFSAFGTFVNYSDPTTYGIQVRSQF